MLGGRHLSVRLRFIVYLLWSIGAFVLFACGNYIAEILVQYAARTFDAQLTAIWLFLILLFLGAYVGVLFVRRWKFSLNIPMLVSAVIPLLLMNSSIQLMLHLPISMSSGLPLDELLCMVTGCVLMVSLFSGD